MTPDLVPDLGALVALVAAFCLMITWIASP
jgi:hypothetical protein